MTDHDPIEVIRDALRRSETFEARSASEAFLALEALAVLRAERDALREALREIATYPSGVLYGPQDIARAALASSEEAYKFPEGDPVEVHPSDSRAESQAGSNGPSGSPTSPSGRDIAARIIRELDTYGDPAIYKLAEAHLALLAEVAASSEEGDDAR